MIGAFLIGMITGATVIMVICCIFLEEKREK